MVAVVTLSLPRNPTFTVGTNQTKTFLGSRSLPTTPISLKERGSVTPTQSFCGYRDNGVGFRTDGTPGVTFPWGVCHSDLSSFV